ncbi:MAG TPA: PKD domain-containing protein [Candidatus Thermoplasmatota archaeon]|nr:PKD domain-containing protein [Candidatus Thermoplasmatota archaeon]
MGAGLLVAALLTTAMPVQAQGAPTVPLGVSNNSVAELTAAGAKPTYASYWVGDWMAVHGWGGLENMLRSAKASGTTPVLFWYYWGDSISPSCVENGCNGRSRAQWNELTTTLASKIDTIMQGAPVFVVLENEFNKGGITSDSYAPTFDRYLEEKARELKAVKGVQIVLGYGAWGESSWHKFPRAIAASEMIGFQIMRASTDPIYGSGANGMAYYRGAPDKIASVLTFIRQLSPGKDALLYDLALSRYPDDTWTKAQNDTLSEILARRGEYAQNGLRGIVYREIRDNPSMSPSNYFGYAEQHWGFKTRHDVLKPSYHTWVAAAKGSVAPPAPAQPNVPGTFEAEGMPATKGGRGTSSSASGGAFWNLWSNGELAQTLTTENALDARIHVVAAGQLAAGVAPKMEVRLGQTLLGTFDVAPGWATYSVDATLPAGSSSLRILFTNDAIVNNEDRNLHVDVASVEARRVNNAPIAAFGHTTSGLSVSVDAGASTDADGDALAYAWSFGDGATATGATATHRYAAEGTYTVTLTVSDGATSDTTSRDVGVVRPNSAPVANLEVRGANLTWSFDASGSSDPDGDALTYAWDLGDGRTASGETVTHTYETPGAKTVTLTATDARGLSASSQRTVEAVQPNRAPTASFAASGANLTWTFDARASSDPDGDAMSYTWSLGEGATATGAVVTHTYATGGAKSVTLTVSDGRGLSSSAERTITAVQPNRAPVASFSASGANLTWTLDARASSDPDGDAMSFAWQLGDGRSASGAVVTHTYASGGPKTATLTVTDARGLASTTQRTIEAVQPNRAPVAAATVNGSLDTYTFDASRSTDPDGDALSYVWSFGDGTSASGMRVSKTYAAAGAYRATVTVTDARGLASTATVTVNATKPFVPFAAEFSGLKGNNWWVQVDVAGNKPVSSVCAIVNGSGCKALTLRSYGWAASFHVPTSSVVSFRVTAATGETVTSGGYTWPSASPVPTATFRPHDGNEWWVQSKVDATAPVKSVCATVNGGACQPLTLRSWGSWAASFRAPTGSKVVFHATFADDYVIKSPTYNWPVK